MSELTLERELAKGNRGKAVRAVQEWLSLNGFGVVVDGDYGPATDFAVRQFQKESGLPETGTVEQSTFQTLVGPLRKAVADCDAAATLGETVVVNAKQHLANHPREIGGQNRGPWVRHYMNGNEGNPWPWCAGFVSHLLKVACECHDVPMPIQPSFSCDVLAMEAKEKGRFLAGSGLDRSIFKPGYLFLVRRTARDWTHVGVVVEANDDVFLTIEGNTNDAGDREGYEVCRRIRGYESKDFIRID